MEHLREYLRNLKAAVAEEGSGQEPLYMDGFIRQMELFTKALEKDAEGRNE